MGNIIAGHLPSKEVILEEYNRRTNPKEIEELHIMERHELHEHNFQWIPSKESPEKETCICTSCGYISGRAKKDDLNQYQIEEMRMSYSSCVEGVALQALREWAMTSIDLSSYEGDSIVEALKEEGFPHDYEFRCTLATSLGIENYKGTAEQNLELLSILREKKMYPVNDELPIAHHPSRR